MLEENSEDGGNRRFILVSATEATVDEPEKNICRDVCAERIRRVINGYGTTAGTGGDFAYLRVRRIPHEAVLADIDHSQVWTALQLIHRQSFYHPPAPPKLGGELLSPPPGSGGARGGQVLPSLLESVDSDSGLIYVTSIVDATIPRILELAGQTAHLTVYTWQPGLLRERLAAQNITIEQIPQFLVSRFGVAS